MGAVLLVCLALLAASCAGELEVVTFATHLPSAFFLLKGLEKHGHKRRVVLGQNMTFKGSLHKVEMLRAHVMSSQVSEQDVLLVSDGYLGFVTAGPGEAMERFLAFGADLVFAAKSGSSGKPDDGASKTRFRYLCSGAFIGRVHALRALLNESITGFETDEAFYRHLFQSRPNLNAKLDTEKQLFCFLGDHENADASDVLVEQDRFLVKETSSTPLLLFGSEREGKHCFYRTLRRKVQPLVRVSNLDMFPLQLKRGETLWVQATVANFNEFDLVDQKPEPAHVYEFGKSFLDYGWNSEFATFRIGLDWADTSMVDHPARWGMGEKILSGNEKTVVLGVRMNTCFQRKEVSVGYVLENFFWVIDLRKFNVSVTC